MTFFAKRLTPLVDDKGSTVATASGVEPRLVTFFNKELKQAYLDLTLQIKASNAMAQLSGEVAYGMDAEVKPGAAATEDSLSRYTTAMESTHALYPMVAGGGQLSGCELPTYATFRGWVRQFLRTYKELFLKGEVVYERVVEEDAWLYVRNEGAEFGYRVRGERQGNAHERSFAFWQNELKTLKMTELKKRIKNSQNRRKEREKVKKGLREKRAAARMGVKAAEQKVAAAALVAKREEQARKAARAAAKKGGAKPAQKAGSRKRRSGGGRGGGASRGARKAPRAGSVKAAQRRGGRNRGGGRGAGDNDGDNGGSDCDGSDRADCDCDGDQDSDRTIATATATAVSRSAAIAVWPTGTAEAARWKTGAMAPPLREGNWTLCRCERPSLITPWRRRLRWVATFPPR